MADTLVNGDGWRARLGVVIPSVNTVVEPWYASMVPDGVSVHFARMFTADKLTPENIREMDEKEGLPAIRQLSSLAPRAIAYGCTASSIVQGLAYDAELRAEIEKTYKVPATTAAHAILTALKMLSVARISIVSPYTDEVDHAEHVFFKKAGLDVLSGANLAISSGLLLASPEPGTLFELGRRGWDKRADALVMTCLNTRSHTVIAALEAELGKPVITSTQATLWHALRLAGVRDPIPGYGRLMLA